MGSDQGIPGRQLGERNESVLAAGWRIVRAGEWWSVLPDDYPVLRSFSVHPPKHKGDRWLVVLRGYSADGEIVAFHKGSTLLVAIAGALERVSHGKADWKPETPWKPRR